MTNKEENPNKNKNIEKEKWTKAYIILDMYEPVSYTHLDVYKRQLLQKLFYMVLLLYCL